MGRKELLEWCTFHFDVLRPNKLTFWLQNTLCSSPIHPGWLSSKMPVPRGMSWLSNIKFEGDMFHEENTGTNGVRKDKRSLDIFRPIPDKDVWFEFVSLNQVDFIWYLVSVFIVRDPQKKEAMPKKTQGVYHIGLKWPFWQFPVVFHKSWAV